jgi:fumarate reductase flavoprotein subunit
MGRGTESPSQIRDELGRAMDGGVGIFRTREGMTATAQTVAELKARYAEVRVVDTCPVYNTDWATTVELGAMLDVAEATVHSALAREESRGSHQRLDGFGGRDDERFLRHSQAWFDPAGPPRLTYSPVTITTSPPASRTYGDAGRTTGGGR